MFVISKGNKPWISLPKEKFLYLKTTKDQQPKRWLNDCTLGLIEVLQSIQEFTMGFFLKNEEQRSK